MYSKNFCKYTSKVFDLARKLGASPINFDQKILKFRIDPKVVLKLKINFGLTSVAFLIGCICVLKAKMFANLEQYHLTVAWCLGYSLVFVGFSFQRLYYTEICHGLNEQTIFLKGLQGKFYRKFCPNTDKINQILDCFLGVLICFTFGVWIFYILYFLYDQQGVIFIGALIPQNLYIFPIALVSFLFHSYTWSVICINVLVVASTVTVYVTYITSFLHKELRLGRKFYKTSDNLRTAQNIRLIYRSLQVLHQHCMLYCPFSLYLVIFNFIFIVATIYITFALTGYWKELSVYAKIPLFIGDSFLIGYWTFILEVGCFLYVGSHKVLWSWKTQDWGFVEQNKFMAKFYRSCTPIILCYGLEFVVGRLSILRYFRVVTRGTIRALLSLR